MITATLTAVFGGASLHITDDGEPVANYRLTQDDGPGPVPAAEAALGRNGWIATTGWEQDAGGVTGGVWSVQVEQRSERETR